MEVAALEVCQVYSPIPFHGQGGGAPRRVVLRSYPHPRTIGGAAALAVGLGASAVDCPDDSVGLVRSVSDAGVFGREMPPAASQINQAVTTGGARLLPMMPCSSYGQPASVASTQLAEGEQETPYSPLPVPDACRLDTCSSLLTTWLFAVVCLWINKHVCRCGACSPGTSCTDGIAAGTWGDGNLARRLAEPRLADFLMRPCCRAAVRLRLIVCLQRGNHLRV